MEDKTNCSNHNFYTILFDNQGGFMLFWGAIDVTFRYLTRIRVKIT